MAFGPEADVVGELNCKGPSSENLRVFMAHIPEGEVVDRVEFGGRTDRIDLPAFVRQVESKYGRPTTGTPANGSWCSVRCGSDQTMEPGPRIDTRSDAWSFKIIGSRGRVARTADDDAVKSAALQTAPSVTRSAF